MQGAAGYLQFEMHPADEGTDAKYAGNSEVVVWGKAVTARDGGGGTRETERRSGGGSGLGKRLREIRFGRGNDGGVRMGFLIGAGVGGGLEQGHLGAGPRPVPMLSGCGREEKDPR